jgi:hypothetical protein
VFINHADERNRSGVPIGRLYDASLRGQAPIKTLCSRTRAGELDPRNAINRNSSEKGAISGELRHQMLQKCTPDVKDRELCVTLVPCMCCLVRKVKHHYYETGNTRCPTCGETWPAYAEACSGRLIVFNIGGEIDALATKYSVDGSPLRSADFMRYVQKMTSTQLARNVRFEQTNTQSMARFLMNGLRAGADGSLWSEETRHTTSPQK